MRKIPNARPSVLDGKYAAKNTPGRDTSAAGRAQVSTPFHTSKPLFLCSASAGTPISAKANKFADCATFCSTPPSRRKSGMVTVPPPIPIPAGIPPKKPKSSKI